MTQPLAEWVEATEGPSRELDQEIADAIWSPPAGHRIWNPPHFTESIDAALTLVPDGWAWSVESSRSFPGHAWLYPPNNVDDISIQGEATTAALALCAAALRARAVASTTERTETCHSKS